MSRAAAPLGGLTAPIAIAAAVALAHGAAVGHGYVHLDDDLYASANPWVQRGLSLDGLGWAFTLGDGSTYFHPLTWLSLMADVTLLGDAPWAHHLVNLALHAASALLLFLLLRRATGRPGPALAAALLWAVHPLTVEAVAWVTERKAVLSTALGLGAALAWTSAPPPRPARRRAAAALLLGAGMLAKPTLVTLPALLLLLDATAAGRAGEAPRPWPRALAAWLAEAWPLLLAAALVLAPALASSARIPPESSLPRPPALRAAQAVASVPTYLGAVAWPTGLAVYHPYPAEVGAGAVALGLAVLALGSAAAWGLRRRWPAARLAWGWFLAALAPSLGLVQNGLWPGWAERFAYLALAGACLAAALGAADLLARWRAPRLAGPALLALALAALVPVTRRQVEAWRDSVTLFERAVAAEPDAPALRLNLGVALLDAGRPAEAAAALAEAVRLAPRFPNAQAALGVALQRLGRPAEAAGHFMAALADQPGHPQALFGLAEALRAAGRPAQARPYYQRFLEVAPPGMAAERAAAAAWAARP